MRENTITKRTIVKFQPNIVLLLWSYGHLEFGAICMPALTLERMWEKYGFWLIYFGKMVTMLEWYIQFSQNKLQMTVNSFSKDSARLQA